MNCQARSRRCGYAADELFRELVRRATGRPRKSETTNWRRKFTAVVKGNFGFAVAGDLGIFVMLWNLKWATSPHLGEGSLTTSSVTQVTKWIAANYAALIDLWKFQLPALDSATDTSVLRPLRVAFPRSTL